MIAIEDKLLMDIEDIREEVMIRLSETTDHVQITRCLEDLTGYTTFSSDEVNKKWVCNNR